MRVVVKLGTSTLTGGSTSLSEDRMSDMARQITGLRSAGHEPILVSSGAIASGREALGHPEVAKGIPAKQMLAAVGQPRLMAMYAGLFHKAGIQVAQVLLTRADLANRRSYLNARNTLAALLRQNILPVVNENDTVATEEIRLGDNDNLSALVANLLEADLLILLTDQPGLFTEDPRRNPAASLVTEITGPNIPDHLWDAAGGPAPRLGTGGMHTKLQAADLARRSGTRVVVARGSDPEVMARLVSGERLGTRFEPVVTAVDGRRRYILAGGAAGGVIVDAGAAQALRRGGSLLPVGIVATEGGFDRGDTVRVADSAGREIARGIVNYRAEDLARLLGRHSQEIEGLLGYDYGDEVVHHNDLVLL
jgi:glutamate 5-kinase